MKEHKGKIITIIICIALFAAYVGFFYLPWTGTYKFEKMEVNGMQIEAGDEFLGIEISKDFLVLEIKSNHMFTIRNGNNEVSGEWEKSGDGLVLIGTSGNKMYITKSFGKVTLNLDGYKYILRKPFF